MNTKYIYMVSIALLAGCAAQVEAPLQDEKPSEHWTRDGGAGEKELPIIPLLVVDGGSK